MDKHVTEISGVVAQGGQVVASLSGRRRVRLVLLLGALSAFGPLSLDMYLPSLPSLSRDLHASASAAQFTLSACLLGLAFGQVIAGPLSDTLGRRRPLLVGMAVYALASLFCAFTPSIPLLIFLRLLQGMAGAAGIVIARAVVRDLFSGIEMARFFSRLMLVNGVAPIVAPLLGGLLLNFVSWRGIFLVLTVVGIVLFLASAFGLEETLPPALRQRGELRTTLKTFRNLLADRAFVGYALAPGLAIAAMFAYIAGSPFVIQDIYGLSPQQFSLIFGTNALGIVIVSQINGRLLGRVSQVKLLLAALIAIAIGGCALLLVVSLHIGLPGILPALFVVVASQGMAIPNGTALALADHPRAAGSASALLGVLQYAFGAAVSPLVGIAGTGTAVPMALIIAILGVTALATFALLARPGNVSPSVTP